MVNHDYFSNAVVVFLALFEFIFGNRWGVFGMSEVFLAMPKVFLAMFGVFLAWSDHHALFTAKVADLKPTLAKKC